MNTPDTKDPRATLELSRLEVSAVVNSLSLCAALLVGDRKAQFEIIGAVGATFAALGPAAVNALIQKAYERGEAAFPGTFEVVHHHQDVSGLSSPGTLNPPQGGLVS